MPCGSSSPADSASHHPLGCCLCLCGRSSAIVRQVPVAPLRHWPSELSISGACLRQQSRHFNWPAPAVCGQRMIGRCLIARPVHRRPICAFESIRANRSADLLAIIRHHSSANINWPARSVGRRTSGQPASDSLLSAETSAQLELGWAAAPSAGHERTPAPPAMRRSRPLCARIRRLSSFAPRVGRPVLGRAASLIWRLI